MCGRVIAESWWWAGMQARSSGARPYQVFSIRQDLLWKTFGNFFNPMSPPIRRWKSSSAKPVHCQDLTPFFFTVGICFFLLWKFQPISWDNWKPRENFRRNLFDLRWRREYEIFLLKSPLLFQRKRGRSEGWSNEGKRWFDLVQHLEGFVSFLGQAPSQAFHKRQTQKDKRRPRNQLDHKKVNFSFQWKDEWELMAATPHGSYRENL